MIQENELVPLIIGVGMLVFLLASHIRLREFPGWRLFVGSFCIYLLGWVFTVVEGIWVGFEAEVLLSTGFNMLEHVCYTVSSILFALWCIIAFGRDKEVRS